MVPEWNLNGQHDLFPIKIPGSVMSQAERA
jgi:hypothetical protein